MSILVTCKPCSDEEVLMAVCTSDFGKYIHTKAHMHIKAVVQYFRNDDYLVCLFECKMKGIWAARQALSKKTNLLTAEKSLKTYTSGIYCFQSLC